VSNKQAKERIFVSRKAAIPMARDAKLPK